MSDPPGINCGSNNSDCNARFTQGTQVTLTATPASGWQFDGWSGDCTGTSTCTLTMDANKTATATFSAIPTYSLQITSRVGEGTITSSPTGIHCGPANSDCNASFSQGTRVTLTATPASGWQFNAWTGACSGAGSCALTMNADQSISATFTRQSYSIQTSATPSTGGTASCSPNPVNHGSTTTCIATPATGYNFTGWSGDCTGTSCTLSNVTSPKSVTANFEIIPVIEDRTLSVSITGPGTVTSSPAGILCQSGECAADFPNGTTVTLTATPASGWQFSAWGDACSGTGACELTMNAARSVSATFTRLTYPIQTSVAPSDGGTVSCIPNPVDHGSTTTCTATPASGYTFTNWSGDCTGTSCTLSNVTSAKSVTANFTRLTYPIQTSATPSTGGTASCSPNPVNHGSTTTCTATPATGYNFTGWSGDCTGTSCTLSNVTSPKSVTANFEIIPVIEDRTLSVSITGPGAITSSPAGILCQSGECAADFPNGTSVTLTALPNPDARLTGWSGACSGTQTTCTLTLNTDQSVAATFETEQPATQTLSVVASGPGRITSAPAGIDCGNDCEEPFTTGTTVILTATPNEGAFFRGWTGACFGTQNNCTLTLSQARSATALFETAPVVENQTLSVAILGPGAVTSSPYGILCQSSDCTANFPDGTSITLTALPDPEATFMGWSDACSGTNASCTLTLDQARRVQAQFNTIAAENLPLAINIVGQGQVQSDPIGIDCTAQCLGYFASGNTLTLTATPTAGWVFSGWEGACSGTNVTCSLNLLSSNAVTAVFEETTIAGEQPLDLVLVGLGSVTSDPPGIDCGTDCQESFLQDTPVTLTATPTTGNIFTGWGGACRDSGTQSQCTLEMNQAQSASATFGGAMVRPETTAWKVAEIYLATLGYAPDHEGLQYWVNNIDGPTQWTSQTVAGSFFDQPLVQAVYPSDAGFESFINALYQNLFSREADDAGYQYWLGQLNSGQIARQHMIISLINGGWSNPDPDALSDMQRFGYRVEVALAFTQYQADAGIVYSQLNEEQQAYLRQLGRDILLGVSADVSTREAAVNSIPILLMPLVN